MIKGIYEKSTANIILNGGRLKASPLQSGTRQVHPLLPFLLNTVLEVISRAAGQEKEMTYIFERKTLFSENIILYIEKPKEPTKKTS